VRVHRIDSSARAVLIVGSALLYLLVLVIGIRVYDTTTPLRVDARADRAFTSPRITDALADHHLGRLHSSHFLGHLVDLGGPPTVIVLSALLAAVALARRDAFGMLLCALAPSAAGVLTEFIGKPLVDRTVGFQTSPVYPSGHVTGAAAVAAVAVALAYRYGGRMAVVAVAPIAAVLPVLVSVGVVGRTSHYATDAVGGLAIGVATTIVAVLVTDAVDRRAKARATVS
jgi:membrane-associated phospholipid phosphatase